MIDFRTLDLVLLFLSIVFLTYFFYKNKKKIGIDGVMYLYRTQVGLKLMDWFGKKHSRWLKALEYPLFFTCYLLVIAGLFLFVYVVFEYLTNPLVYNNLRAPIILPPLPYFTEFFGLSSFLPKFYFVTFLFSISITMIIHEFAHGIYARLYNVRIKSSGFATIRLFKIPLPLFGAFVEQDDKQMLKAPRRAQLAILGAGVFSNILITILFVGILWAFFALAFQPVGVSFIEDYSLTSLNSSKVNSINGVSFDKFNLSTLNFNNRTQYYELKVNNSIYYTSAEAVNASILGEFDNIWAYEDTPAFRSKLRGIITHIDGEFMNSKEEIRSTILSHKPFEKITIETIYLGEKLSFNITLAERNGNAYLGVMSSDGASTAGGVKRVIYYVSLVTPKKEYSPQTGIVYASKIGETGIFFFDLFWWVVLLNFAVALSNMLPAGFLDGGRFFMLSVEGATKSKKAGEIAFKIGTYFVLFLFVAFMIWWTFLNIIQPFYFKFF